MAPVPPVPEMVEIVPSVATLRMVELPVSATSMVPSLLIQMSCGLLMPAWVASLVGENRNHAVGVHLADRVIARYGDVQVARGIDRDRRGRVNLRVRGCAA